jgi:PAS domain S-box-containing protein
MSNTSIWSGSTQGPLNHAKGHSVQLYVDDRHLINVSARYIARALAAGERGVVVATPAHRRGLSTRLLTLGFDLETLTKQGRFITLDAADTLNLFMAGGHVDELLFPSAVKTVFERVQELSRGAAQPIRIFGELVGLLWAAGKAEDAIHFETLWNRLENDDSFSTLCAYPIMGFYNEKELELFVRICAEHSGLFLSGNVHCDLGPLSDQAQADPLEFQEELISQEAALRFQLLVEAVRERAAFMIDLDGRIVTWNSGAEWIHGYAASEVIGRRMSFLDNEDDSPQSRFKSKLATAIQKGSFKEECWRTRKDGSRFLATFTIAPARNESGDLMGFSETIRLSKTIQWVEEPEPLQNRTCRTILLRRRSSRP